LKNDINTKDDQLKQFNNSISTFEKKFESIKELEKQIESKSNLVQVLQESIKLKDNQLETVKDSLRMKDEQINMLESSLKSKDGKIETLDKTLKLQKDQMESLSSQSVDQNILDQKEKEISNLNEQIDNYKNQVNVLTEELTKADEDFEKIESEYDKLKQNPDNAADSKIMDFTIKEITREEIINEMKNILKESTHSVTIAVPKIDDLQELQLYELRSSVNMKISCEINAALEGHAELLDEYESLDNISLRHFEGADRYIINRDGEELLIAIKGSHENNHLVFKTKDPSHIKFLSSLVMESWLRSKKL